MRYQDIIIFLCFITLVTPSFARANVVFSEVMYDFPGTELNGDHDWVEVVNNGSIPVDISTFKFFEATTNHGLKLDRGLATIQPGSFAVIANATSTFLADWPNFSGTLFDSSFNLNGTGELLKFCSGSCAPDGSNLEDSVTYVPLESATDEGDSLQKDSSGSWVTALPTPGTGLLSGDDNSLNTQNADSSTSGNDIPTDSELVVTGDTRWPVEPQVFANAGKDKVVVVGASSVFDGKALGLEKKPLENAHFIWNFGDGATGEGRMVEHTYRYPGDYLVVMEVVSGYFSGIDQLKVQALPSPLLVSAITDGAGYFIEIANSSNTNIDISGWGLALNDKVFTIPKNTFVMAGKKLIFSNEVTGLSVGEGSVPELHYPNGTLASRFGEVKGKAVEAIAVVAPTSGQKVVSAKTVSGVSEITAKNGVKIAQAALGEPRISGVRAEENNQALGNMAAVAESLPKKSSTNYTWLLGVVGISALALTGVFLARRLEKPYDEIQKLADEIEIIEG